jgi:hypothetical protein
MKNIFLFNGKEKTGPFSEEDLKSLTLSDNMLFCYNEMQKWLPIEMLTNVTLENKTSLKPIKVINYRLITTMWILTSIILLLVLILYTIFFNEFGEIELVQFSLYWFPPLAFSITTLISAYSKSKKPLLYGLLAAVSAIIFLIFFFGTIWSAL